MTAEGFDSLEKGQKAGLVVLRIVHRHFYLRRERSGTVREPRERVPQKEHKHYSKIEPEIKGIFWQKVFFQNPALRSPSVFRAFGLLRRAFDYAFPAIPSRNGTGI